MRRSRWHLEPTVEQPRVYKLRFAVPYADRAAFAGLRRAVAGLADAPEKLMGVREPYTVTHPSETPTDEHRETIAEARAVFDSARAEIKALHAESTRRICDLGGYVDCGDASDLDFCLGAPKFPGEYYVPEIRLIDGEVHAVCTDDSALYKAAINRE